MFDPTPKLHDGSIQMGHGVRSADNTRVTLVNGSDGAPWLALTVLRLDLAVLRDVIEVPSDDALAVLRSVDPVWQAALEVVRAQDDLPDVAPESALEIALALVPIGQAIRKLRIVMEGGEATEQCEQLDELRDARFVCPRCGSMCWGSSNCTGPIEAMIGSCHGCSFTWPRTDDAKYWRPASEGNCPEVK